MKAQLAALALLGAAACGPADTAPDKPRPPTVVAWEGAPLALTGRVVDAAQLIADRDEQALSGKLAALEKTTSDQLIVVTVPGLHGETIEQHTIALGNRWAIGGADVDNGVIILVAPAEHEVRVEVGLGLKGLLTDAKAAGVIKAMMPRFKNNDFAGGLLIGVDAVDRLLHSDRRRPQRKPAALKEAA